MFHIIISNFYQVIRKVLDIKNVNYLEKFFLLIQHLDLNVWHKKKDCFFFNFKNKFFGFKFLKFPVSKNGSNWSDSLNEKKLIEKIDKFMKNKTVKNFNKNNKKYYSRIIYYDYKNNILKKNLKKIFKNYT